MAKTVAKFQYERRTAEDVKTRANMKGGGFDTFILPKYKVYKVKDGKNLIRIMPKTWKRKPGEPNHYAYTLWVNYGIGIDNQSYLSLSKMLGKPDPISEARREAEAQGDEKLARSLAPRQRSCMWLIDRMAEDEGPQLWPAPFTVDKDFNTISQDEDTKAVVYIDHEEEGADVRFYKEGQGLGTKYPPARMKIQSITPLHEDESLQNEWLAFTQANPIPDCLQYYSYEHIQQVFGGQARVERNDEDEDEAPIRPRSARRAPVDEDEAPPARSRAAPVEDDEEETPAPKRRARVVEEDEDEAPPPKLKAKVAEPEDDEEYDDETGELPPVKARAKTNGKKAPPDEDEAAPTTSIRERLQRRRSPQAAADDDD